MPTSCDISSSSCIFYVDTSWSSVSNLKSYDNWLWWSIRSSFAKCSFPAYPSAPSICYKFRAINIFWFLVYHGAEQLQLSNIKLPNTSLFFPRGSPFISNLSILPASLLTILHFLYLFGFKFLSLSFFPSPYLLPKTTDPYLRCHFWPLIYVPHHAFPGILPHPEANRWVFGQIPCMGR